MRTLNLVLTLIDDLVASERPATEGGHESLDFLPGAMLLGAAAVGLYSHRSRYDAYLLFHSGQVRYGDAVPLFDGRPGWPMPLCWHERKGDSARCDDGCLDPGKLRNFQFGRFPGGTQPKQMRTGFVGNDGRQQIIEKAMRMKTAIDPETGRVAESQLFGYDAMRSGQVFEARIEADPDLPAALWDALVETYTGTSELLLGRSRSAEYGRVGVEIAAQPVPLPRTGASSGTMTLWCLSDLALIDTWGQPTLEPLPQHLGLSRGTLDWDRTFLRFRRFTPWNAYRGAFDLQRQVIRRGSVITLADINPPLSDEERKRFAPGIGLYREQGMGRVCIDPTLLADVTPRFSAPAPVINHSQPATDPGHPLITWLRRQHTGGAARHSAETESRKYSAALRKRYRLARAYGGTPDELATGPSPAQWGSVYEQARTETSRPALIAALFDGESAACKPRAEGWQDKFRDANGVCFKSRVWRSLPVSCRTAKVIRLRA